MRYPGGALVKRVPCRTIDVTENKKTSNPRKCPIETFIPGRLTSCSYLTRHFLPIDGVANLMSNMLSFALALAGSASALTLPTFLQSHGQAQSPLRPLDHSQNYQFDPLLHLPGISPYFDAVGA
jgi:hypothetical protein